MKRRLVGIALAAVVPLVTLGFVFTDKDSAGPAVAARDAAPLSADAFAEAFVGVTTLHARTTGDPARIRNADCVQAAPGRYMCSYRVDRPGGPRTCHLMQARTTPEITVTLAGRTRRCGSLSEALASLR